MALKKSQLYSSLWQSCDELRGGMDASQYKDYVLTLLFMKYVSDKCAGSPNALIEVPEGAGFVDMAKLKGDKEIGDKIIGRLAEVNDLKGVIDQADFNDESKLGTGKEMQDRLSKLVAIFDGLDFRANRALARMKMILHGHPTAELWRGNTLAAPDFKNKGGSLKTFDFTVANPPFFAKAWSSGLDPANDEFGRFEYGIPPAKNGDYAFLLHLIKSLKSKGAIILPHGVLFRGNKEADIRRNLIQRGLIKGIIGLPTNLFYGTGIPACILVIDKEHAHVRTGIFMIDASKGFVKDGNKNRLRAQDIHRIVDVFNRQIEQPRYSRMVPVSEIASPANNYNLNIPRYIDSSEPEDLHDLDAHLNRGIPVEVVRKDIKNLHVGVYLPNGRVRVAAPLHLDGDAVRLAVISRLRWIRRQQVAFERQERQSERELVTGESHYFAARRYRVNVIEHDGPPTVSLPNNTTMESRVRPGTRPAKREAVLQQWYRKCLREQLPALLAKWGPAVGVTVSEVCVKKMKTRWGSCDAEARRIWLNLEVAKKPASCLEYILLHETVHFLERRHNERFRKLLDVRTASWRLRREELNRVPLAHEAWRY